LEVFILGRKERVVQVKFKERFNFLNCGEGFPTRKGYFPLIFQIGGAKKREGFNFRNFFNEGGKL